MRRAELLRMIIAAGFELIRSGGSHDLYRKGDQQIPLSRGRRVPPRLAKLTLVKLKRVA